MFEISAADLELVDGEVRSTDGTLRQPLVEVTDAQAALTRAQTELVNARYDRLNAQAALDRAVGRYGYGEKPGLATPAALRK